MPVEYSLVERGVPGNASAPKKWHANTHAREATTESGMIDKISRDSSLVHWCAGRY
jgi:hypothetical protein